MGRGLLADVKRRKALLKLSEKAFQAGQGLIEFSELETQWNSEIITSNSQSNVEVGIDTVSTDLEQILADTQDKPGFRWRLDCLNKSLGSLREGDFGFIFARPETGKTTFLASEISKFLSQGNKPILWFNNEEQGHKVMLRIYQAFFGATLEQLYNNPRKFKQEFQEITAGRLYLYDSAMLHKKEIERAVSQHSPGIVVYDQIDKIKGFNNDRDDLRLGSIYQWGRELAKNNHAAIGVCQADGHAEGVRYLTMEHVANAKTSKQAEADFILGIGKTHDQETAYVRYLNICKNKLMGDKDSIPDLRHGRFEVIIEPQVARYKDVIHYD